jgi:hypothetical protein
MDKQSPDKHKFQQNSEMTFEQVFRFSIGQFTSIIRNLAAELNREDIIQLLQKASSDAGAANTGQWAANLPENDFEAWTRPMREQDRFWQHVLTTEIVENTETTFEVKITECLWAKAYREADAAEIGYATICHPDYAMCQAFNPNIRMIRTKTLMQGDDHCNHRWLWDD